MFQTIMCYISLKENSGILPVRHLMLDELLDPEPFLIQRVKKIWVVALLQHKSEVALYICVSEVRNRTLVSNNVSSLFIV